VGLFICLTYLLPGVFLFLHAPSGHNDNYNYPLGEFCGCGWKASKHRAPHGKRGAFLLLL